jgi:hypothetical protein
MGLFGGSHHSYHNPADAAMPYLQDIPGTVTPQYQSYINRGQQSGDVLSSQYGEMSNNPSGYYNSIMAGYTPSPMYQYNKQQLMGQDSAAAAAGGYAGTAYDRGVEDQDISGLLSQDEQSYFNNIFGINDYGLRGQGQLYNTGYQASSSLADALASNLAAEAGLQYQGTAGENQYYQQKRNNRNSLIGMGIGASAGRFF